MHVTAAFRTLRRPHLACRQVHVWRDHNYSARVVNLDQKGQEFDTNPEVLIETERPNAKSDGDT